MDSSVQHPQGDVALEADRTAEYMAEQVIEGFIAHDAGDRGGAIEAFYNVDALQFAHLNDEDARLAATCYVDALFEKDEVEFRHLRGGDIDAESLEMADWGPVRQRFRMRAGVVGMDAEYAIASTEAWKRHKTGGDYWTPIQRAQLIEFRAAIGDPEYPNKPKYGQSGFGPEAMRYALAIELHDMHDWDYVEQAVDVMTPYFDFILTNQRHDDA